MKLNINGYEVEIKAKYTDFRQKNNKEDTIAILNMISTWAGEAAKSYDGRGRDALARHAAKASDDIYFFLDDLGAYDF